MPEVSPIYEFILWNNCNNNCTFCHQKHNRKKYPSKFLSNDEKYDSIKAVYSFIEKLNTQKTFHVLLMGGEIFDIGLPSKVKSELFSLGYLIAHYMKRNIIEYLYINSNLIYPDSALVTEFLDIFKEVKLLERIKFTSSYDIAFRFKTELDESYHNIFCERLAVQYNEMAKVQNCILTDKACDYINGLDDTKLTEKFFGNSWAFNFIPYIKLNKSSPDELAPTRKKLLSTLVRINRCVPDFLDRYTENLKAEQPRYIYEYNKGMLEYASSGNAECGHNENFRYVYNDSTDCFICDVLNLQKLK